MKLQEEGQTEDSSANDWNKPVAASIEIGIAVLVVTI
jgi:hypothetical protein